MEQAIELDPESSTHHVDWHTTLEVEETVTPDSSRGELPQIHRAFESVAWPASGVDVPASIRAVHAERDHVIHRRLIKCDRCTAVGTAPIHGPPHAVTTQDAEPVEERVDWFYEALPSFVYWGVHIGRWLSNTGMV